MKQSHLPNNHINTSDLHEETILMENCPSFIRFINTNTEAKPHQIKPFLRKALIGSEYPKTMLELRGPFDTGKSLFLDFLISSVGEKNTLRIRINDLKNAKLEALNAYKLIIIYESLYDLTNRQIANLKSVLTDEKIKCLFVKITDIYDVELKPLPPELSTSLIFKRSSINDYGIELKNVIKNEIDGIYKWAMEG